MFRNGNCSQLVKMQESSLPLLPSIWKLTSPELASLIMWKFPSTPSLGNTVDKMFLGHSSPRGHP